jgi:hypothetical protein
MARFSVAILVAVIVSMMNEESSAFVVPSRSTSTTRPAMATLTSLSSMKDSSSVSRRDALFGVAAAAMLVVAAPQPASAKYSDYVRREKDWQERSDAGGVKVSSARDLKNQLQEIAPMNTSASQLFCPNGPSSNVSPMMENKCGDRMATPSVYGRTADTVGNSIPGFKDGYALTGGDGTSISASIGGFPAYKENEWTIREYKDSIR